MNMKKSIAGVMAGAMAVSAMAATVSAVDAQETIELYYDLNEWCYDNWTKDGKTPSVTMMQYYTTAAGADNMVLDAAQTALVAAGNIGAIKFGPTVAGSYVWTPSSIELNMAAAPMTGATGASAANVTWSWAGAELKTNTGVTYNVAQGATFAVPVTDGTVGANFVNISSFDLAALGYTGTGYGFTAITAKMVFEVTGNGWNAPVTEATMKTEITGCATTEIVNATAAVVSPTTFSITEGNWTEWTITGKKPMKTALKNPGNVIDAISSGKEWGKKYTNPIAVLNDAIANGTNVTFTFVTCGADVLENGMAKDSGVFAKESRSPIVWKTSNFQQHLYNRDYVPGFSGAGQGTLDNFGSYSNAWGYNLFEGAIVVNSGITMQLNQAEKFIWDQNSLTFDWDTITADGNITNAKQLLQSMLLYTPVDWYWDTLNVVVEKGEDDKADVESPVTENDDVITDAEIADTTTAEETTTAAAQEIPSTPATGNAPVALAVIPVALAAAAVVAKKRG